MPAIEEKLPPNQVRPSGVMLTALTDKVGSINGVKVGSVFPSIVRRIVASPLIAAAMIRPSGSTFIAPNELKARVASMPCRHSKKDRSEDPSAFNRRIDRMRPRLTLWTG